MKRSLAFLGTLFVPAAVWAQSPPASTTPIQHVVVIFQENISFDHYFATYPNALNKTTGEPVFTAAPNTPYVNGLNGALLTANPNSVQPIRLTRAQAVTCDQNHNYTPEQQAYDSGLVDKFPEMVGSSSASCDVGGLGKGVVMAYFDGNTVTAMWNYAQNFAMSDNSFSTTFGPSTPGALHLISGQTHGATLVSGSAAGNVSSGSVIGDPRPALALDDCTIKTAAQITMSGKHVGDLLNAKNLTWGWFQGGFRPSSVSGGTATCATAHNNVSGASAGTDYIPHHEPFQYYPQSANIHHVPPTSVAAIGTAADVTNHQYDLVDFFAALQTGNMPAVSYLKAAAYQDGHPGYSDPLDEQTFLVNTINTIMRSPFWSSTAIIIAYDDSDGWYDHVMPPIVSPSSTADDALAGAGSCGNGTNNAYQGRCGYGPRQPLLVISPYAKVNYVDHSVTDQSSILRFIEDNWNLGRIGDNSMDAVAGTLNGMFNFSSPSAAALFLDPTTGTSTPPTAVQPTLPTGNANPANQTTSAVAYPKNASVTVAAIQLDGAASTSYDRKALKYFWSMGPGSLGATITGANTPTPSVQFNGGVGNYAFLLTVTDDLGNTSTDIATVTYASH
jgi:phospholipase C